ncbi:MAG: ABC transporter ATP-binding protein [Candidatus Omnitrophica bacterium]|nr:ABC transporter ATP-binding protein [Candidatus Omnitrophota bacterium]
MNAIEIDQLSKCFHLADRSRRSRFMDRLRGIRPGARQDDSFWALREVTFKVACGERVAIIGANGSGKTTLLRILARIIAPTAGEARLRGRVGSIIEIGSGFHPELTGRENVFLNGVIIGMTTSEIKQKFDRIVDFSGIGQFIDTPIKYYSNGMYLRLAFAVAAHADADILLLDEVIAVGDDEFQKQSRAKLLEFSKEGRTLLTVSHDLPILKQLCTKVILMGHGKVEQAGEDMENIFCSYLAQ